MNLNILILCWLIIGIICSKLAKNRGRNHYAWFFIGVVFGLLGIIALYVLPYRKNSEELAPAMGSTQMENIPINETHTVIPTSNQPTTLWYYLDDANTQYGPMSFNALQGAWDDDKINSDTYVWNEQMDNWKTLEEIPDTLKKIRKSPN